MFGALFKGNPKKQAVKAIESGDLESLKALLERGMTVNEKLPVQDGGRLIHYAAINDRSDIVDYLISRNASLDVLDDTGWTPLDEAIRTKKRGAAKILAAAKAPLKQKSLSSLYSLVGNDCADYVCDWAFKAVLSGDMAEAPGLLDAGFDINAALPGLYGQRLIHLSAVHDRDLTKLLVKKGADVNVADEQGHTPLDAALSDGRKEVALFLRSKGAVTGVRGSGEMEALDRELNPVREDVTLIREVAGCHLTENFNFSTRMVACAVKNDGKVVQFDETPFDEFRNRPRLREAFDAYKKQGGTADDSVLTPGYDSRRKEPLARKPAATP